MRKFILFMLLMLTMGIDRVSAQNVYIATSSGAVAYHKNKSCGYLKHARQVKTVSLSMAEDIGRHACPSCYGEKKYRATEKTAAKKRAAYNKKVAKTTAKKTATTKKIVKKTVEKPAAKKTVRKTTVRKTTRKTAEESPTTKATKKKTTKKVTKKSTKKTPARDSKGRFVKAA